MALRDPRFIGLFALLPSLYWTGGPATAPALKHAAIVEISVPPDQAGAWKQAGFTVTPLSADDLAKRIKLTPPGIDRKVMVASATTAPWVNGNGWQIRRAPGHEFRYEVPAGDAPLAAAEAFAYGAHAVLQIQPSDLDALGEMLRFLRSLPERNLPDIADFGFLDDGSDMSGETLNLLTRRNLLYRIVKAPDPHLRLNLPPNGDDPQLFAAKVREQLHDDERSLRVYGSEVALCRLTGDGAQARIHILNYGRPVDGVRLRVRGTWAAGKLYAFGTDKGLSDFAAADGFTEFSLPELRVYAVVDLSRK